MRLVAPLLTPHSDLLANVHRRNDLHGAFKEFPSRVFYLLFMAAAWIFVRAGTLAAIESKKMSTYVDNVMRGEITNTMNVRKLLWLSCGLTRF